MSDSPLSHSPCLSLGSSLPYSLSLCVTLHANVVVCVRLRGNYWCVEDNTARTVSVLFSRDPEDMTFVLVEHSKSGPEPTKYEVEEVVVVVFGTLPPANPFQVTGQRNTPWQGVRRARLMASLLENSACLWAEHPLAELTP